MLLKLFLIFLMLTSFVVSSNAQISPEDRAVIRTDVLNRNIDLTRHQKNEIKKIFLSFERQYDKLMIQYSSDANTLGDIISSKEYLMHKSIVDVLDQSQGEMYVILVSNNYEMNPKKISNYQRAKIYTSGE